MFFIGLQSVGWRGFGIPSRYFRWEETERGNVAIKETERGNAAIKETERGNVAINFWFFNKKIRPSNQITFKILCLKKNLQKHE